MVTARTSRPDPVLIAGVGVVSIGIVVFVISLLFPGHNVVRTITTAPVATPANVTRHLSSGTWFVYQTADFQPNANPGAEDYPTGPLQPGQVVVTSPSGQRRPVGFAGLPSTLTVGSHGYFAELEFSVATSGNYDVRVDAPNTEIMVATPLAFRYQIDLAGAVGAAGGEVTIIAGITLLIIAKVRRRRAKAVARSEWAWSSRGNPGAWR